jgi:hypothetical protein
MTVKGILASLNRFKTIFCGAIQCALRGQLGVGNNFVCMEVEVCVTGIRTSTQAHPNAAQQRQ